MNELCEALYYYADDMQWAQIQAAKAGEREGEVLLDASRLGTRYPFIRNEAISCEIDPS